MRRLLAAIALACVLGAARAERPLQVSLPISLTPDQSAAMSASIITLLERETGRSFELASHGNALAYLSELGNTRFAVVFEGPHVLGALSARGDMLPIAEFRGDISYVVVAPSAAEQVFQLGDLGGKPLCTGQVPDLFGLHLVTVIDNPAREPILVAEADYRRRIRQLLAGRCRAATLQTSRYLALSENEGADALRIIYKSREMPGFGVAVAAELDAALRETITRALLSREGVRATRALSIGLIGSEVPLSPSDPQRFQSLASLMQAYYAW